MWSLDQQYQAHWELVRNVASQAYPRPAGSEILQAGPALCTLKDLRDSDVCHIREPLAKVLRENQLTLPAGELVEGAEGSWKYSECEACHLGSILSPMGICGVSLSKLDSVGSYEKRVYWSLFSYSTVLLWEMRKPFGDYEMLSKSNLCFN